MSADVLPEGTTVRVVARSACGDPTIDESAGRPDGEYVVAAYCAGPDGDDPEGLPYYLLDVEGVSFGGNYWAYPEHVEAVRTVEANAARKPPSVAAITRDLSGALHDMHDAVDVVESIVMGADRGVIMASGETVDGLRVRFRVRVDQVEQVDF